MREAKKSDLPKGNEAQCVLCWRLFTSDSACERHKPYSKPKGKECKSPASLGYEALERRGLTVWQPPSRKPSNPPDEGQPWRFDTTHCENGCYACELGSP